MKKLLSLCMALLLVFGVCSCAGKTADTSDGNKRAGSEDAASDGTTDASVAVGQTSAEPSGRSEAAAPTSDAAEETSVAQLGEAKEFTSVVTLQYDWLEFCLPEDHNSTSFTDLGATCLITVDRYTNDVVAYHEYDDEGETVKKTVGSYTFDYQKFHHFNIDDWIMYVIRIVHNGEYYRIIYNVYATDYDDAQVEKFMATIRFLG